MATRRSEDMPSRRKAPAGLGAEATPAPRASRARGVAAAEGAAPAAPASLAKKPAPETATPRRARARPAVAPDADLPPAGATPAEESTKANSFWRAGLRALDNVRHDVQRRQASVIETLLGIAPAAAGAEPRLNLPGLPGLDAFGMRKFEDVFDQRVAAALERLGMPTRDELQALHDKLDQVLVQLERIGSLADADAAEPDDSAKPKRRAPRTRTSR